jgi:hypothetical protein
MNTISAVQASLDQQARDFYERMRIKRGWAVGNAYRLEYKLWEGLWVSYDRFFKNANELADFYHEQVDTKGDMFEFDTLWMWDRDKAVVIDDIFPHLSRHYSQETYG